MKKKYAIIVAGGKGERMGSLIAKQFIPIYGKPILYYSLIAFIEAFSDIHLIVVLPEKHIEERKKIEKLLPSTHVVDWLIGGENRFSSVKNGLQLIDQPAVVFVHDGARCLVTPRLIQRCYKMACAHGNAVPCIALKESIRKVEKDMNQAVDRHLLKIVQTPQVFDIDMLKKAFEQPYQLHFTDEATLVEAIGIPIQLCEGEVNNIKVTYPYDIKIAEYVLGEKYTITIH